MAEAITPHELKPGKGMPQPKLTMLDIQVRSAGVSFMIHGRHLKRQPAPQLSVVLSA